MRWSVEGQTAEFLAATRMVSLDDRVVATILDRVPLKQGMRVLDVGCGSGECAFRLGSQVQGVEFTGLEFDRRFVDLATRRAAGEVGYPFEAPNPANGYRFVCGDGCDLPFDDGSFDAVVSHTYLTAVADWQAALAEMIRVCRSGGVVASVTSMTDNFYGTGFIGLFAELPQGADAELLRRVEAAKNEAFQAMDITAGIAPRLVPAVFDQAGLQQVRCVPLGQYFCLSDASVSREEYRRHIDLLRAVEEEQLERLAESLPSADRAGYQRLIDRRCNELLAQFGRNHEWAWYGNSALLVYGVAVAAGVRSGS